MTHSKEHPRKDQLIAFGLGTLEPAEADQIAEHLYKCDDCSETIVNLQDDTFVALVRSSPAPAPFEEPELDSHSDAAMLSDITVDTSSSVPSRNAPDDLPRELREHPKFEFLGLLGHGGMGDVFKAQHRMMDRVVALKVIKPDLMRNDAAVQRFRREVQAAARLRHPNIVTAFDAEQAGDLHYLVMEYVEGVTLDEVVSANGPLPAGDACDYIRQAAEGLQHAHDLGMVHRDIKPHNLMIEQQMGTIIGNATVVKILDFGLANLATEVVAEELHAADNLGQSELQDSPPLGPDLMQKLTQMGSTMGTPDYMAPEQAQDAHTADIRADIYSLGCTFYMLLTGRAPFDSDSVLEKLKAHRKHQALPISDYRDSVPADVEAIVRKMMAKDPAERFQTPAEIAAALEPLSPSSKHVERTLPVGKPEGQLRRVAPIAAIATLFIAAIIAAIVFYIHTNLGVVRVEVADESLEVKLRGQTIRIEDGQKSFDIRPGVQQLVVHRPDSEFVLVTDAFEIRRRDRIAIKVELLAGEVVVSKNGKRFHAEPLPKSELLSSTDGLISEVRQFGIHDRQINTLAIDAKGERIATAAEDGTYRVWELSSGRELLKIDRQTSRNRQNADISPDGKYVALGGDWESGDIEIWEVSTRRKVSQIDAPTKSALVVAFSPDGRTLASGGKNRTVWLWDVETGQKRFELKGHQDTVCSLDFSPDGNTLLSGSFDKSIRLWEVTRGALLREFAGVSNHVRSVAFGPDGRHFVAATYIPTFFLYEVEKEQPVGTFSGHVDKPSSLVFSADGRHVISGSPDKSLRVWDVHTTQEVTQFKSKTHSTNLVVVVPNTGDVITAGGWNMDNPSRHGDGDYSIHVRRLPDDIWPNVDSSGFLQTRRFEGNHLKPVTAVDVSRSGRLILSTSYDRTVRVWDRGSGREVCSFLKHGKSAETAAFSPNSETVASSGGDGSVWLWDAHTGASIREFKGHTGMVRSLAFSPDGGLLVTGSADYGPGYGTTDRDNTLRLWDIKTGAELHRFEGVTQAINAAAFAPDGKTIAAGGEHKMVGLWDTASGKQLAKFPSPNTHPVSLAFSPDGRTIATGHAALVQLKGKQSFFDPKNSVVCLWDVASRRLRRKLGGHTAPVNAVTFSSDSRLVVSGCGGHHHDYSWSPAQRNSLRVWDADSGKQLAVRDLSFSIESVALFPDGKSIVVGGGDLAIGSGDDQPDIVLWSLPESVWPKSDLDGSANSLDFDGHSSHVETPIRYDGSHPLTIEALATPRVVSDKNQVLVGDSQASGLALMLRDDGHWRFGIWDKKRRNYVRAASEKSAVANRRVHLAGVLESNEVRLYVDGELQGEPVKLNEMTPSGLPMMIGANWEPGNRFWEHFAGVMDEVRISRVARYNKENFAPKVRFHSDEDTLALYHFDEGFGNTASDSSGNNRYANVVNAKWVLESVGPIEPIESP